MFCKDKQVMIAVRHVFAYKEMLENNELKIQKNRQHWAQDTKQKNKNKNKQNKQKTMQKNPAKKKTKTKTNKTTTTTTTTTAHIAHYLFHMVEYHIIDNSK